MCTEHLGYKRTFTRPYLFPFSFSLVTRDRGQNSRCLLSTHHGYPCVGPHIQETRAVKKTGFFLKLVFVLVHLLKSSQNIHKDKENKEILRLYSETENNQCYVSLLLRYGVDDSYPYARPHMP